MTMIERAARDTVLVVDDAPTSLAMVTDALEEAGYMVLVAVDGESALSLIQHVTPNAILLDAVMPGMDGFETSLLLKKNDALQDVPVIFMTGLSDTEHIVRGLEAGGVDYITKPINPLELIARLRVHLANAKNSQSARIALDVSGRFLLSVDQNGYPLWSTSQAKTMLGLDSEPQVADDTTTEHVTVDAGETRKAGRLPGKALVWLDEHLEGTDARTRYRREITLSVKGQTLRLSYLGEIKRGEHLLRIVEGDRDDTSSVLKGRFSLTERESDVLTWITNGKTNKEIASILDMSPRTVNKHLDRIFAKLGVENRTSAAIVSLQAIMKAAGHS